MLMCFCLNNHLISTYTSVSVYTPGLWSHLCTRGRSSLSPTRHEEKHAATDHNNQLSVWKLSLIVLLLVDHFFKNLCSIYCTIYLFNFMIHASLTSETHDFELIGLANLNFKQEQTFQHSMGQSGKNRCVHRRNDVAVNKNSFFVSFFQFKDLLH